MRPRAILTGLLACSLFRDNNNSNASAFVYTSTSSCLHSFYSNTCKRQQCVGSCPTSPSQFEDHVTTATCRAAARSHTRRRRPRSTALSSTAGSAGESIREGGDDGEDATSAASTPNMSSGSGGSAGGEVPIGENKNDEQEKKDATNDESADEGEDGEDAEQLFVPAGDISDRRLYRAKLLAGSDKKWREQLKRNINTGQLGGQDAWAHELSSPEQGCLIVAKSREFSLSQHYFNEAVIFLASHDESGSAGFILNRPTKVALGELVEGNTLPNFQASPLYLGGDVGEGNVQILHRFGPEKLPGAMEIIPGVFIGGVVDEADRMVAAGKAKPEDFRFFLHLCGWAPGQLEAEIKRGVWFSAACSSNPRLLTVNAAEFPTELQSNIRLEKKQKVILKHCMQLPVPMWREVMTLMGPKYGLLARDTYDDL